MTVATRIAVSLFLATTFCIAQSTQPVRPHGARPYPPGGKVSAYVDAAPSAGSLDGLIRHAKLIVDGIVVSVPAGINTHPDADIPSAETHSSFSVTQVLRGSLAPDTKTICLVQTGGKAGKWDVAVMDDPLVTAGERYILFLVPDSRKQPASGCAGPRYGAVGVWAGKVSIADDGKIHFRDAAAPALHQYDNTDVTQFVAAIKERIENMDAQGPKGPIGPPTLDPPPHRPRP